MEKYSKQREEVLTVLKESYDHPTAEEIYQKVKKKNSTASRGTVYRNLNFLINKEEISKISMQIGPDRYDYFRKPHHHAICKTCGKVFDFEYSFDLTKIEESIKEQTDIQMIEQSLVVEGICKDCKLLEKTQKV